MKKSHFKDQISYYYKRIKKSPILRTLISLGVLIGIVVIFFKSQIEVVISAFIGIMVSLTLRNGYKAYKSQREDQIKSNENLNTLKKRYPNIEPFKLDLNPSLDLFFVDLGLVEDKKISFDLDLEPFELDVFIKNNVFDIMNSHQMSSYHNEPTVRLKNVNCAKENDIIYILQPSNYYKHLLTNRAIDYPIQGGISLRDIFEPGPKLSPLNTSKFSNHIGLNMIIILSDNYIIMPFRRKDATYSKNRVTSSVATRFIVSECKTYTIEDIKCQLICLSIDKLQIPKEEIENKIEELHFIGAAQSVYEGGKPQFYFAIKLDNYSSMDYFKLIKTPKLKNYKEGIDQDEKIYILDLDTLTVLDHYKIKAASLCDKQKYKTLEPEKSFFANLYYLTQSKHFKDIFID